MKKYDLDKIEEVISKKVDVKRMAHSVAVKNTAACLAMKHGYEAGMRAEEHRDFIHKAMVAGILHDNAKCVSDSDMLAACEEACVYANPYEKRNPFLLHAKLGAYYAAHFFGVEESEIISAIACHTVGRENMTLLDKIIFIADYIEPLRNKQRDLDEVRYLAFTDVDRCVFKILNDTLCYLAENHKEIDDATVKTRDFYKKVIEEKEKNG